MAMMNPELFAESARPSVLFRPALQYREPRDEAEKAIAFMARYISTDGDRSVIVGFGPTADAAMRAFDRNWNLPPGEHSSPQIDTSLCKEQS